MRSDKSSANSVVIAALGKVATYVVIAIANRLETKAQQRPGSLASRLTRLDPVVLDELD
jgi:hypothetical protein